MFLLITSVLLSCNSGGSFGGASLGGKAGELLIVINNEYVHTDISTQINSVLNQYEVGLVQSEPPFNILTISRNHFSSVFRSHRNILFIDVHPKHTKPQVTFHKNMWTQNQVYVAVGVNRADTLVDVLRTYHKQMIDFMIDAEISRYLQAYQAMPNKRDQDAIRAKFNMHIDVPKGFEIRRSEENFMWISLESPDHSQGIIIYERPYADTMQLEKWPILQYRDSLLRKYMPGPTSGSYMTTEYILPIRYSVGRYINNGYTVELNGKWRVEHDFMAGPFVSYTFVDAVRKRLFTIDGYVYYPNKNKRNYMRQLQAICRSITFIDSK
jgi:hypothetical protein